MGAVLLAAAGVGVAAADDASEPIHLEYHAGAGCPGEDAFVARVHARMARVRLVDGGEGVRRFTVELTRGGGHPSGSVTVAGRARSEGTRRLEADTCDEVADALALMVVLAIDPRALTASETSPPSSAFDAGAPLASPPPDASALSDASALPDASAPPDAMTPPASPTPPAPPPAIEPPAPPAATPPPARPLHFFAGGDFVLATGVTPSTLFTGAPFVGWRTVRPSLLGASVRAAFLRAGTGAVGVVGGSAEFTWTVGRIDGCAMLWPDHSLRLGACARAEVGVLEVSGESGPARETQQSAWVAAGALARLEWSFFGPLVFDLEGGPSFHISADHFYFREDSTSGYYVPIVGLSAESGLALHFLDRTPRGGH